MDEGPPGVLLLATEPCHVTERNHLFKGPIFWESGHVAGPGQIVFEKHRIGQGPLEGLQLGKDETIMLNFGVGRIRRTVKSVG